MENTMVSTQAFLRNYQFLLAMVFAIEDINENPLLLQNISLGFDFCNIPHTE
jgi:hypothetical protein